MDAQLKALLKVAARLQTLVPGAVLVGGTAAACHAGHRLSLDDDHAVAHLQGRFDDVLAALEDSKGWVTARIQRPVLILGNLDGVETGIRNLIRSRPLEIEEARVDDYIVKVPTLEEILRINAWLCLIRNATRDYLDFAALAHALGESEAAVTTAALDDYYVDQRGTGGLRIATQAAKQLAAPTPFDLAQVDLKSYRKLDARWHEWAAVEAVCRRVALDVLDQVAGGGA